MGVCKMVGAWRQLVLLPFLALTVNAAELVNDPVLQWENPPAEARPQIWYHLIGERISVPGIKADFAAMGKAGFGTAHVFAVGQGSLPANVTTLSPQWYELMRTITEEAVRQGMTLGFHNCPGWSSSGGPWIEPENAMKTLVFSGTVVRRGAGKVKLPQPRHDRRLYRDVAVLAFPAAQAEAVLLNDKASLAAGWDVFMTCPRRPLSCRRTGSEVRLHTTAANYRGYYRAFVQWLKERRPEARLLSEIDAPAAGAFMDHVKATAHTVRDRQQSQVKIEIPSGLFRMLDAIPADCRSGFLLPKLAE